MAYAFHAMGGDWLSVRMNLRGLAPLSAPPANQLEQLLRDWFAPEPGASGPSFYAYDVAALDARYAGATMAPCNSLNMPTR